MLGIAATSKAISRCAGFGRGLPARITPTALALLLACGGLWGQVRRASAPASPSAWQGPPEEEWLSRIVLDELAACPPGAKRQELGGRIQGLILARLACGRLDSLAALNDMVYALRACTHLAPLEMQDRAGEGGDGGRKSRNGRRLAAWLLDRRDIARLLLRALGDVESPAEALGRFGELLDAEEARVLAYPDLAVAFATSTPLQHYRRQPDPPTMLECFRYYTDPKTTFRHDLKKLPYELLRYLADTRLSMEERWWAMAAYGLSGDLTAAYTHFPYDEDHWNAGKPKKIDSVPYTLMNLSRLGGVCMDQAYFASEVCKALGVPATMINGRGGEGVSHAWIAWLRPAGRGGAPSWNTRTGRYEEGNYYVGTIREPASGRTIIDAELTLLGSAVRLPLRVREEADAATFLAALVDGLRDGSPRADVEPLKDLAAEYGSRYAGVASAPPPRTDWIAPRHRIDLALTEELLVASIQRNVAHGAAWQLVHDLRKSDRMPVKDLSRFFDLLIDRTADRYPEYSCMLILRIAPAVPEPEQREQVYRRAMDVYARRPDLRGRILLALGDDYLQRGAKDKALATYRQAASTCVHLAEIVLKAAGRAEELLMEANQRDAAIGMYKDLFGRTRHMPIAEVFRADTSHYQIGLRLARLLKAAGQQEAAEQVLRKING